MNNMLVIFYIFAILIGLYSLLILLLLIGFSKLKTSDTNAEFTTDFSVIIPFRNESKNLSDLLHSIKEINYPKSRYEIIFVNDDSTDNSLEIIHKFCADYNLINVQTINNKRLSNSPKKDAINTAISITKHHWIVTTDADCILPKTWLSSFNANICNYSPNMMVAPVKIIGENSFLDQFQMIDFLSMQGATIGGFGIKQAFMANGANLAYKKELFIALNGFKDNDFIASGDDVFLLENFLAFDKSKVLFVKNSTALVSTFPTKNWYDLVQQRKRWAAKTTHFKSNMTKSIGLIVFFANFISALALVFGCSHAIFFLVLLPKFIVDALLIFKTANLYQQKINFFNYLKTVFFHPFFTVYIAIMSVSSTFVWKERQYNK